MAVNTIELHDFVTDAADVPVPNALVTLTFGYNQATTSDGLLQPSARQVTTDSTGKFSFAKVIPNDLISPANTVYQIDTPFRSYQVAPQSGNGASQVSTAANVIVNTPSPLAPATSNVTGPLTVAGLLTAQAGLTVAGAVTLPAASIADSDLSANVPLKNVANVFTGDIDAPTFEATGAASLGSPQSGRFIGEWTTTGSPTGLTAELGDFGFDGNQVMYVCTVAGTPGTWVATQSRTAIAQPSDPASMTGLTFLMMGLGVTITPRATGRLLIFISGTSRNDTVGGSATGRIQYGTGAAPVNGAALAGTAVGHEQTLQYNTPTNTLIQIGFCLPGLATGLTLGTTYWIDLALRCLFAGSNAAVLNTTVVVVEI